jgi:hypothetical protein
VDSANPLLEDVHMRREHHDLGLLHVRLAVVRYLESSDLLKEHKQAAYRHFQSREFNQVAIADRFTKLLVPSLPSFND